MYFRIWIALGKFLNTRDITNADTSIIRKTSHITHIRIAFGGLVILFLVFFLEK